MASANLPFGNRANFLLWGFESPQQAQAAQVAKSAL
ncbi:MAG: hypothetical protein ACI9DF_002924 [Verrucomicrobiales bacterium]|jgi:hypothetical protein